jgi:hypothetical protein
MMMLMWMMNAGGDDSVEFPSVAVTEQQDLPSPVEEENFCLFHRLRKKWALSWPSRLPLSLMLLHLLKNFSGKKC